MKKEEGDYLNTQETKRLNSLRYKADKKGLRIVTGSNDCYKFNGTEYVPQKGYAILTKKENQFIAGYGESFTLPMSGKTEFICYMTLEEAETYIEAYKEEL